MLENYQTVIYVLCFVIPVEYVAIATASLVSKIVVVNFLKDLGAAARSRETKNECATASANVMSRYKESIFWPLEIWRALRGKV
jgi:hypothetical protein